MDAYLGAQVEVLEGVELSIPYESMELSSSPNSHIISSDDHFTTNVHLDGSGFKVPVPGVFESLDFNQFDYMGIEEEVYYTPIKPFQDFHSIGLDQFMVGDVQEFSKKSRLSNKNDSVQRQQKFKKGWEEIKAKVAVMNNRTGTKTSVHAIFDNVIYFMDVKPSNRISSTQQEEDTISNVDASVVETDHRYAAVILTQKDSSSSIQDHQYYNQPSSSKDFITGNTSETFIKRRYKREKQLVTYLKSLFAKKKLLEDTAGTKISLEISYEHYLFNSENFETAEHILSENRQKLFRVPIVPTFDANTFSSFPSNLNQNPNYPKVVMTVERIPAINGVTPGVHVKYLGKNENATAIVKPSCNIESENSSHSSREATSSNTISSELLTLDHPYGILPISSKRSEPPNYNLTDPDEDITSIQFHNLSLPNDIPLTKNVGVSTEPICGICGSHETVSESIQQVVWLRCFNPLCMYMVHPNCLGFPINSMSQLLTFPPYLCPQHR